MMKTILISYRVFKEGEMIEEACTTIFGNRDYGELFKNALENLRIKNVGCNVYAVNMTIL